MKLRLQDGDENIKIDRLVAVRINFHQVNTVAQRQALVYHRLNEGNLVKRAVDFPATAKGHSCVSPTHNAEFFICHRVAL